MTWQMGNARCNVRRYDPYEKKFTEEFYDHELMRKNRKEAIEKAAAADKWGVILGTLGRQASMNEYIVRVKDFS